MRHQKWNGDQLRNQKEERDNTSKSDSIHTYAQR